jgi:hypothetical protein
MKNSGDQTAAIDDEKFFPAILITFAVSKTTRTGITLHGICFWCESIVPFLIPHFPGKTRLDPAPFRKLSSVYSLEEALRVTCISNSPYYF